MNKPALNKIIAGTLTVCFCMSLALSGKAQECRDRHSLALRWGGSVPLGNQFLSKAGYSGGGLEWDWHFSSCFSVGLGVGYRSSSEKGMTEDCYDGGSVSGYSDRSYSSLPLTVHARYLPFGRNGFKLQPYLNLSGGMQYVVFRITGDQINTSRTKDWGGLVLPGIGCRYAPWEKGRIAFDLRCSWKLASNRWTLLDADSEQGIEVMAGMVFRF